MNLNPFKEQHNEILTIVTRIERLSELGARHCAKELCTELIRLRFKIRLHLSVEDNLLYPSVFSGDLGDIASKYKQEMMEIASAFASYAAKWEKEESIVLAPMEFTAETSHVIRLLRHRIQKENVEFYPAVDAKKTSAFR